MQEHGMYATFFSYLPLKPASSKQDSGWDYLDSHYYVMHLVYLNTTFFLCSPLGWIFWRWASWRASRSGAIELRGEAGGGRPDRVPPVCRHGPPRWGRVHVHVRAWRPQLHIPRRVPAHDRYGKESRFLIIILFLCVLHSFSSSSKYQTGESSEFHSSSFLPSCVPCVLLRLAHYLIAGDSPLLSVFMGFNHFYLSLYSLLLWHKDSINRSIFQVQLYGLSLILYCCLYNNILTLYYVFILIAFS